jgi:hypothetical protein
MTTPLKVLLDSPLHPWRAFAMELAGLIRERERVDDPILGAAINELLEERCAAFEKELGQSLQSDDWARLCDVLAPADAGGEGRAEPTTEALLMGYVRSTFQGCGPSRPDDRPRPLLVLDPGALARCETGDGRPGVTDQVSLDAVQLAKRLAANSIVVRRGLSSELLEAIGSAIAARAVRESRSILTSLGSGDDVFGAALRSRMSERGYQVWCVANTVAAEPEALVQVRQVADTCHQRWLDGALESPP